MRATRLGDQDSGHDECPPRSLNSASANVFVNGKGAGRIGDEYPVHECEVHKPHTGVIASGSSTVYINSKGAGRVGDAVSCGGTVAEGSADVYIDSTE